MDLGATICTPKQPRLRALPVAARLRGVGGRHAEGAAEEDPEEGQADAARASPISPGAWTGRGCSRRGPTRGCWAACSAGRGRNGWTSRPPCRKPSRRFAPNGETLPEEARHTFTHFHLRLTLRTALLPMDREPLRGAFVLPQDFSPADLPTLMRKAFDLARPR